jgi:hypothetical protein
LLGQVPFLAEFVDAMKNPRKYRQAGLLRQGFDLAYQGLEVRKTPLLCVKPADLVDDQRIALRHMLAPQLRDLPGERHVAVAAPFDVGGLADFSGDGVECRKSVRFAQASDLLTQRLDIDICRGQKAVECFPPPLRLQVPDLPGQCGEVRFAACAGLVDEKIEHLPALVLRQMFELAAERRQERLLERVAGDDEQAERLHPLVLRHVFELATDRNEPRARRLPSVHVGRGDQVFEFGQARRFRKRLDFLYLVVERKTIGRFGLWRRIERDMRCCAGAGRWKHIGLFG